jgi:rubrerythrin
LVDIVIERVNKLGKVKVLRCRLCRESYIGEEAPSRCPFCGALGWFFISAENWDPSEYVFEISDVSKATLEAALKLELSNTEFYLCAMKAAQANGDEYGYAKFKALKNVENEHAEAIVKLLKIKESSLKKISCSNNFKENTQEGWERENRAIKAYAKFAKEAPELQLKQFFESLVEIETDHLELHAENLKKITKM